MSAELQLNRTWALLQCLGEPARKVMWTVSSCAIGSR